LLPAMGAAGATIRLVLANGTSRRATRLLLAAGLSLRGWRFWGAVAVDGEAVAGAGHAIDEPAERGGAVLPAGQQVFPERIEAAGRIRL